MTDEFEEYRKTLGDKVVDTFIAKFGLGPDFTPIQDSHECPQCGQNNAYYKELHADCNGGQNTIVLHCPDCGWSEDI